MAARGYSQKVDPFESLINTISGVLSPVIQESLRRAIGSAMGVAPGLPSPAQRRPVTAAAPTSTPIGNGGGSAGTCSESGCTNPPRCKGLCSKHYQAARRALTASGAEEPEVKDAVADEAEMEEEAGPDEEPDKKRGKRGKGRKAMEEEDADGEELAR